MSCFHPLQALKNMDRFVVKKDGSLYNPISIRGQLDVPFQSYEYVDKNTGEVIDVDPFNIPCGRCLGCRLDYAKAWANRMTLESITMKEDFLPHLDDFYICSHTMDVYKQECEPWFITFTYDDFHLNHGECTDEGISYPTLKQKDFQDFLKRLRERLYRVHGYEGSLEYYYCGEYGDRTARPHYHAIIWNLPLYNLKKYTKTKLGDILYNDCEITSLWGKGHVVIAKANWATCAYVGRYVMKKQNKTHSEMCEIFDSINIEAPFVRMSRRPGVGLRFYEAHKHDIYMRDQIVLPSRTKGFTFKVKPPHIFDTKYGEEFPEELLKIKQSRDEARKIAEQNLLKKTNKDLIVSLMDAEEIKKKEIQSLRRLL